MVLYFPDNCTTHCFALLGRSNWLICREINGVKNHQESHFFKSIYLYAVVGALCAGVRGSQDGGREGIRMSNNLIMERSGAMEIFLYQIAIATIAET